MFKKIYTSLTVCFLIGIVTLSGCKKEEKMNTSCSDSGGVPIINQVRTWDKSTVITEGDYNEYVVIQGQNLCDVRSLKFNDLEIRSVDIYATDTEVVVRVPKVAPDVVNDKITLQTSKGTVEYDFHVNIPPIKIQNVSNEYAPVGTEMLLLGQSFDYGGYMKGQGKIFFGTKEASVVKASLDSLIVIVPDGAVRGDIIKGVDRHGTEFAYQYPYKDNTNMVVNYDDKPTANWNRVNYVGMDQLPGPLEGNYSHVVERPVRNNFASDEFVKGKLVYTQDMINNPGNYVIKFEVNTSIPVTVTAIRITGDNGTPAKFHAWNFNSGAPLNTKGNWVTQSISLQSATGNTVPLTARNNNSYELRGWITMQTGVNMDISFDNWRIVAKPVQ